MRPEELEYIRPRDYAAMRGVHYRTIINHFNKGALDGYRDEFGNIWIRNPRWQDAPKGDHSLDAILYARVSSSSNKMGRWSACVPTQQLVVIEWSVSTRRLRLDSMRGARCLARY